MKIKEYNAGKAIRRARVVFGMTQEELAQKVYLSRITICNYECNRREPSIQTLQLIMSALEIESLDEFLEISITKDENEEGKGTSSWVAIHLTEAEVNSLENVLIPLLEKWVAVEKDLKKL